MALPAVQEPQLQPLMAAVSAEYKQYDANPVALAAPKESQPWPCTVSQSELDVFANMVDSDNDPVMKAELLNDARSSGMPLTKVTHTNKVVKPVRAQCEGGKLSGPLEFWIEYDHAMSNTQFTMKSRNLLRVRANARDGKPDGTVLLVGTSLSQQTDYADAGTAAMMAEQPKSKVTNVFFVAIKPAGQVPKATWTTNRIVVDGSLSVTTQTRFSRQNGQVVDDGYGTFGRPEHHDYRKLRRNGKLHGPQQTFAGKMGDFAVEASTKCWLEGEQVLTNTCPSD
jgi:hypothetical protein